MGKKTVVSPDKAMWMVEVPINDSSDETALAVSVHRRGENAHCNTWVKKPSGWERLIDEKISGKPIPDMLVREVHRLTENQEIKKMINNKSSLQFALIKLEKECYDLAFEFSRKI